MMEREPIPVSVWKSVVVVVEAVFAQVFEGTAQKEEKPHPILLSPSPLTNLHHKQLV
jgi:hypothetical protein